MPVVVDVPGAVADDRLDEVRCAERRLTRDRARSALARAPRPARLAGRLALRGAPARARAGAAAPRGSVGRGGRSRQDRHGARGYGPDPMAPVRSGRSGWNYRSWKERTSIRRNVRKGDGWSPTPRGSTPSSSTPPSTGCPSAGSHGWVERTPDEFVFAVKASRYLTHMKRLTDLAEGRRESLGAAGAAASRPPSWARCSGSSRGNFQRDDERLAHALGQLPAGPPRLRVPGTRPGSPTTSWRCCASTGASRW